MNLPITPCFNFHKDKEISYLPSIKTGNEHIIFVKLPLPTKDKEC
ncbi:hypothetical protein HMPREF9441_00916 [Paraprevotella clara YIT 11840]|uniref:Uncharacterized protein n=1 Tax=Paraprevotella clara YIT 11840 TaxID=762968 RepID=G5SNI6_9BACT|nr:hypothetical protein HMPREF9441_00916 [Paraprevotella clara YIT 11840]